MRLVRSYNYGVTSSIGLIVLVGPIGSCRSCGEFACSGAAFPCQAQSNKKGKANGKNDGGDNECCPDLRSHGMAVMMSLTRLFTKCIVPRTVNCIVYTIAGAPAEIAIVLQYAGMTRFVRSPT